MNWRDVGFLVIGLFVGANVGLFVLALCVAARRGDELAHSSRLIADSEERRRTGDGGRWGLIERDVVTNPDPETEAPLKRVLKRNVPYTQEWEDDAAVDPRVVHERKVIISKRCVSPRAPTKKPSGPPPPPPPGPKQAVKE